MEKLVKRRNSSIELLRIVCMLIVLLRHYVSQQDTWWNSWASMDYGINVLVMQLAATPQIANSIFMMITGYFLIKSKVNFKNVIKLILELFLYAWIIAIVIYGLKLQPFSVKEAIKALVPVWFGYNWYVCCYIIFCCFVPFINPFLNSLEKDTYKKLVIVTVLIWSVMWTFKGTNYMGGTFSFDRFVVMYIVGGYIRLYGLKLRFFKSWWKLFWISLAVIMSLTVVLSLGGHLLHIDSLVNNALYFSDGTSILIMICSVSLFMAVLNAKPLHSPFINKVAGSCVGVFIIHHNPLLRRVLWDMISPNEAYTYSPWLPVHMIVKCVMIFVVCVIIDRIRIVVLDKPFDTLSDRLLSAAQMLTAKAKTLTQR